ncbi:MAG: Gldg family protein [bacterium]|nr:Gldg family protein [bacterium]MDT8365440.1 Gldg family protein [bacterium]
MDRRTIFSPVGLLAAVILFIAVNLTAGPVLRWARVDLTQGDLHSLSDGTINILQKLGNTITLKLFWSEEAAADLPGLKVFARRVKETLQEYEARAGGKIKLTIVDPKPFSEEEDEAVGFGLQGVSVQEGGDNLYFGLAATSEDGRSLIIPFIQADREIFFEYDISQMIHTLANPEKVKVGLLSALPISGGPTPQNPFQAQVPWVISDQLNRQFDVEVILSEKVIPEDVDVLMVVHPHGLSDSALYAADQFVLRGGRALVFADPVSEFESGSRPGAGLSEEGTVDKLLAAWGLAMESGRVVGDMTVSQRVSYRDDNQVKTVNYLPWLALREDLINREEVTTAQLDNLNLASAGSLTQTEDARTSLTPLLSSSTRSMLLDGSYLVFRPDPAKLLSEFSPSGVSFTLAARIKGPAATAFPDGPPADENAGEEKKQLGEHLTKSADDINVVVVADSDLLQDRFWVEVQDFFGQRLALPMADNANLVINLLDQLGGSSDLIGIRSRASTFRPFELFDRVSQDADLKYRVKEQELVSRLKEAERKLNELQSQRQDSESPEFTPEQEEELENFRQEKVKVRRELRNVQFELRRDIERLQAWIKFINIGLVPLLLVIFAVGSWAVRRRKQGGQ